MGEAFAGLGQGLQSGMQGYHTGRKMVLAERQQEANRLYDLADRYSKHADQYRETDPDTYATLWKAYAETIEQADKTAGAKGPGAWKTIKPFLSHLIPGLGDKGRSGGAGASASGAPPAASAPMGAPQETEGGSPQESAPRGDQQGQSIYQMMANNPPKSQTQVQEERAKSAYDAVGNVMGMYKTQGDVDKDPNGWARITGALLVANKAGLGQQMEKMISDRFNYNDKEADKEASQFDLTGADGIGKAAGLPLDFKMKVPKSMLPGLLGQVPKAKEKLDNRHAELAIEFARGDLAEGTPGYKEYKQLDSIVNPANTEIEMWAAGGDIKKNLESYLSLKKSLMKDPNDSINYMTDALGNVYQTIYNQETKKSDTRIMTMGGRPVNLGPKGVDMMPFVKDGRLGADTYGQPLPNWAGMQAALNMWVSSGGATGTSPEEATRDWLPRVAGKDGENMYMESKSGREPVPNPNVNALMSMINAAKAGQPVPKPEGVVQPPVVTPTAPSQQNNNGQNNNGQYPQYPVRFGAPGLTLTNPYMTPPPQRN